MSYIVIFAAFVVASTKFSLPLNKNEVRIVIMGDFGYGEARSSIKKDVVASIRKMHQDEPFDLGLILGDNVYPLGCKRSDFTKLKQVFSDSFSSSEFNFPFLTILGNHDYYGDVETQLNFYKSESRFYLPSRYYTYSVLLKDGTNISFLATDSNPLMEHSMIKAYGLNDAVQKIFLDDQLKKTSAWHYIFLLSHHNVISSFGPHTEIASQNVLFHLANKYKVTAVITGHNHNMQYVPRAEGRDFDHFVSGSSSKLSKVTHQSSYPTGWFNDKTGGFSTLTITNKVASFLFYDRSGQLLHSVELPNRL